MLLSVDGVCDSTGVAVATANAITAGIARAFARSGWGVAAKCRSFPQYLQAVPATRHVD